MSLMNGTGTQLFLNEAKDRCTDPPTPIVCHYRLELIDTIPLYIQRQQQQKPQIFAHLHLFESHSRVLCSMY